MSDKRKSDWGSVLDMDNTAEVSPAPTPVERPAASQAEPAPVAPPARRRRARRPPPKYARTYRLPATALDALDAAKDAAAERGELLSLEDAVAHAIDTTYGHLLLDEDDEE